MLVTIESLEITPLSISSVTLDCQGPHSKRSYFLTTSNMSATTTTTQTGARATLQADASSTSPPVPASSAHELTTTTSSLPASRNAAQSSSSNASKQGPTESQQKEEEEADIYDEIEIEDMTYDRTLQIYHYPCPCGDRFEIAIASLKDGEDIAVCPGCSLTIRVIFDAGDLEQA